MAMVKAFSYGSGSVEVANKLQFEGIDYLAVAYADEGIALRKNGIERPIMVMNANEHSFNLLIYLFFYSIVAFSFFSFSSASLLTSIILLLSRLS